MRVRSVDFLFPPVLIMLLIDAPLGNSLPVVSKNVLTLQNETNAIPPEDEEGNEGLYLWDDMIIVRDYEKSRSALTGGLWPDAKIVYRISQSMSKVDTFRHAIGRIQQISCVTFEEAVQGVHNYWLDVTGDQSGCFATVGFQHVQGGMSQIANFGPECSEGNIVHELMHTLGFYHEHVRDDRDEYVAINYNNIIQASTHNFQKTSDQGIQTTSYNVPYNYESIMHYGSAFFSSGGLTITVKDNHPLDALGNTGNMGQRNVVTQGDKDMINARYCAGKGLGSADGVDTGSKNPSESHTQEGPHAQTPPSKPGKPPCIPPPPGVSPIFGCKKN